MSDGRTTAGRPGAVPAFGQGLAAHHGGARGAPGPKALIAWGLALGGLVASAACGRPAVVDPQARAEARKIWSERCANCHGDRGQGNGPGALILNVQPRRLSDASWQAQVDDARIRTVIVEGGQAVGLSPLMAANPDLRTKPEVVDALVELIRDL